MASKEVKTSTEDADFSDVNSTAGGNKTCDLACILGIFGGGTSAAKTEKTPLVKKEETPEERKVRMAAEFSKFVAK